MRRRSYEFYEVRTSLTDDHATVLRRGPRSICEQWMTNNAENVDANGCNLYLVRVQLVEAYKADKK